MDTDRILKWMQWTLIGILGLFGFSILSFAFILYVASLYAGYLAIQSGQFQVAGNIGAFAGASATLILVAITGWYAYTTRKHVQLANRRMDYDIRRQHSETLRRIVSLWLGNPEQHEDLNKRSLRIPHVTPTDIQPAPALAPILGEQEFRVVPETIENDLYLEDLLENHAPDLKETKQEIEQLHSQFIELKSQFVEKYEDTQVVEDLPFPAETSLFFEEWAFERVLYLERGIRDEESLFDIVDSAIDRNTEADEDYTRYPGDNRNVVSVIKVSRDVDEDRELVADAMKETISRLPEQKGYSIGQEAAMVLDKADEECQKLEQLLVEYRGRPMFPGDCEYIAEARMAD